uniref:Uncharacterized protein n=1 Tax=Anopheles maculatus TaxID=74869 RepID=A0A182SHS2_9DIPT
MFRRVRDFINGIVRAFAVVPDDEQNLVQSMDVPPSTDNSVQQSNEKFVDIMQAMEKENNPIAVKDSMNLDGIFLDDEPLIYENLLLWDPETPPPHLLKYILKTLNSDHRKGLKQSPIHVFYRIFLNKQLSERRTKRPRFLTAERRARINNRRKERLEAAAHQ